MNIKKFILGFLGFFVLSAGITIGVALVQKNQDVREKAAPATTVFISPTTQNVGLGNDFSFFVKMDSGENALSGVDIRVNFDSSAIEIKSLEKGQDAGNLDSTISSTFDNSTGKIKYIIYTADKTKALSGSNLEILKINAKTKINAVKKDYPITFDPLTAAAGLTETQNVITTKTPGSITLTDYVSPTPTPYVEGEPNSCGGTCGSNYNCAMNYFCFEGFCRNPVCPKDKTCGCATATAKSTAKATPKATKTPEVVYYPGTTTVSTPRTTLKPLETFAPVGEISTTTKKTDWVFIGILSAVGASLFFTIWAMAKAFKKPDSPESPPTTTF